MTGRRFAVSAGAVGRGPVYPVAFVPQGPLLCRWSAVAPKASDRSGNS